jgi:hypothetical protein
VAIYLDANLLYPWRSFAEVDRIALTIVAQQIQQRVLVPEVAAWEGEAHYRRNLERAASGLKRAHRAAGDAFRGEQLPQLAPLDVDAPVERWREELRRFTEVLPLDPADASEAYRREAFGVPPAKRVITDKGDDIGGKGGRDAAIWLTVLRDHEGREEEGHFISCNTSDFGKTAELKLALASELDPGRPPLNYYGSLDDFLAFLGNPERGGVAVSLVEVEHRLPSVLRVVMPVTWHIPRAVFGSDFDWARFRYHTEIKDARPTEVLASRRYKQEREAITVVNASWEIVVDCFQLSADDDVGPVLGYEDVLVTGSIQFYLPDDEELVAQVVSSRLVAENLPSPVQGIGG